MSNEMDEYRAKIDDHMKDRRSNDGRRLSDYESPEFVDGGLLVAGAILLMAAIILL